MLLVLTDFSLCRHWPIRGPNDRTTCLRMTLTLMVPPQQLQSQPGGVEGGVALEGEPAPGHEHEGGEEEEDLRGTHPHPQPHPH